MICSNCQPSKSYKLRNMSTPNGHFSGGTKGMVEKATEKAKGTSGKFYEIMTKHGFFDIADEANNLTAWQRAGVPEYNQHRISDRRRR